MLRHCPSHLESWVDRLFTRATAEVLRGELCENPVTGSSFVFGRDSISAQKENALRAQRARWYFGMTKPGDFPSLPVNRREWPRMVYESPVDWLVVHYARSWSSNEYDLNHPDIAMYAGGLRASGLIAGSAVGDFIRSDVEQLLGRFQPRQLSGRLDASLVWRNQRSVRSVPRPTRRSHNTGARRPQPKLYTTRRSDAS
jgi:hypothetical protein